MTLAPNLAAAHIALGQLLLLREAQYGDALKEGYGLHIGSAAHNTVLSTVAYAPTVAKAGGHLSRIRLSEVRRTRSRDVLQRPVFAASSYAALRDVAGGKAG